MLSKALTLMLLGTIFFAPSVFAVEDTSGVPLLDQARTASPRRYEFAMNQGARIYPTPDGRSFYVIWDPPELDLGTALPVIVTLHGHGSWALDEFALWHPYAELNGYTVIAIQWWFASGEEGQDYYAPQELYPVIEKILRQRGTQKKTVLLHGFSRGATQIYALTALDQSTGNNFFAMTLPDAGGAMPDYPPNTKIDGGFYGDQPFLQTHWVLFCGGQDPNPLRDGCEAMRSTQQWVQKLGGTVDLFIEDPNAGHGGFHKDPNHVAEALNVFERLLGHDVVE